MDLKKHKENWNNLAKENAPEWVVDTRKTEWDSEEFFETGRILIEDLFDYLKENNIEYRRERVLDFGCGVGRLSQSLCQYFDFVDGTDISEEMVKQATTKNKFRDRCRYFTSDNERLDQIPNETYDVVFTYATLQHIEPYFVERYLKSFLRILKPGGILLFQEHAYAFDLKMRLKDYIKKILPRDFVNFVKNLKNKGQPIMEVFAISRARVKKVITANGGEIICSREEPNASGAYKTYFYVAKKR